MEDDPPRAATAPGAWIDASTENRRRDGRIAADPDVPPIYGSKFHIASTDRDVRIAFGAMHVPTADDGSQIHRPVYRAAVFMPYPTLFDLRDALVTLCNRLEVEDRAAEFPEAESLEAQAARQGDAG